MKSFSIKRTAKGTKTTEIGTDPDGLEPRVNVTEWEEQAVFTLEYEFPGFWFYCETEPQNSLRIDGNDIVFTQVKVPKAGFLNEFDKPLLPSFGRYLQIPFSFRFGAINNLEKEEATLEKLEKEAGGTIRIKRSEYELSDSDSDVEWGRECNDFDYKESFFNDFYRPNSYPADDEIVKVTGPFFIDGYKALLVHVRPFQYRRPSLGELVFYDRIRFEIELEPHKGWRLVPDNEACFAGAYENLFLNPERDIETRMRLPVQYQPADVPDATELLIIYGDEAILQHVERLKRWKQQKGLATEIVSVGRILSSAKTNDAAMAIREFIVSKRETVMSRLRYVLLFGDVEKIPFEDKVKSDFYYTTPKNFTGVESVFPWLACGRIPLSSPEDAESVVDQIIYYEKDPPRDPEYYKEMAFCAYFEDSAYYWQKKREETDDKDSSNYVKTMEDILEHLEPLGFNIQRIYVMEKEVAVRKYCNGQAIPQGLVKNEISSETDAERRLLDAANKGRLIIGHRGHATAHRWRFPRLKPEDLEKMPRQKDEKISERREPSIFFSLNCLTGKFKRGEDCFGEKLLKHYGAAPSLIAPTRPSNTWLNNSMMKALFDALWPGLIKLFPDRDGRALRHSRLGDIMNYAKAYLPIAQSNADGKIRQHFEIYHVLGDPTLEVWKCEPASFPFSVEERNGYLTIWPVGDVFPDDGMFTICSGEGANFTVHKRILPGDSLRQSIEKVFEGPAPEKGYRVCFHAPGYRLGVWPEQEGETGGK